MVTSNILANFSRIARYQIFDSQTEAIFPYKIYSCLIIVVPTIQTAIDKNYANYTNIVITIKENR